MSHIQFTALLLHASSRIMTKFYLNFNNISVGSTFRAVKNH